ncbi:MAG: type II toxin-antitoxin system mRNA interferase toxin, RelE/StbE family [Proteobacteria bacterium]|nr:MAG: type II toxin-antitoxin system mRNA interferase toxin, RelE/StbE family [Pseudomonadota bacterium]
MAKYDVYYSKSFKKNLKKFRKEVDLIKDIVKRLANDEILEPKYKDHALKGNFKGFRECHVRPDLVLIYEKDEGILVLTAINIGSHSGLF